jgi:tetratricopeptide (TPR) repeat protein
MREIVREFEVLESDYLLEESREQTVRERQKQAKKVLTLQTTAISLLTLVVLSVDLRLCDAAPGAKGRDDDQNITRTTRSRSTRARTASPRSPASAMSHAAPRLWRIRICRTRRTPSISSSRSLLQTPTGNEMEAGFSREQLKDALDYCMRGLPALEQAPALGVERLRAYGNIGQLHLKLRDAPRPSPTSPRPASRPPSSSPKAPLNRRSSRSTSSGWAATACCSPTSADARAGMPTRSPAEGGHRESRKGLAAAPKNRLARNECARAWLEYGLRTLRNGDTADSEQALARVPVILDPKLIGHDLINDEKFILARAKFAKGISQREAGKIEEALNTLIDSVKDMGELVLGSSPRNQDQALLLAEAYTELAELIGRHFSGADAKEAHNQAVPILLELNRLLPEWGEVKYLLARNYGALASLARDAGSPSEASKKKQDAIELVNEILADDKDNARYGFLLAKLRGEYAELLADGGKTTAAIPIAKQAVESLEA